MSITCFDDVAPTASIFFVCCIGETESMQTDIQQNTRKGDMMRRSTHARNNPKHVSKQAHAQTHHERKGSGVELVSRCFCVVVKRTKIGTSMTCGNISQNVVQTSTLATTGVEGYYRLSPLRLCPHPSRPCLTSCMLSLAAACPARCLHIVLSYCCVCSLL